MAENNHRPLRSRPRERNFRFSDYSKPQNRSPKDDKTLSRKGPQVELVRPKWNGTAPLTIRVLPMTEAEDPSRLEPTRLSTDDYDLSDFIRGLPAVKYVGVDQKFTFLAYDPRRCDDEGYNPRTDNPYHVLYNAITAAVKNGEAIVNGRDVLTGKWGPLVMNGPKKAFNAPTKLYYLQGLVYENDADIFVKDGLPKGLNKEDLPQIIQISKSAGDELVKKLNKLDPEYSGDTDIDNQNSMYQYGDIVHLKAGMFLTLFNPDKHKNVSDMFETDDDSKSQGDDSFQSWGVAINPTFRYPNRREFIEVDGDISEYEQLIVSKIVPWDDILYFPTDEEIALWMAQAFRSIPSVLEFGWADNPEFFTDEVAGILANRVQGSVPAGHDEDSEEGQSVAPPPRQSQQKPTKPVATKVATAPATANSRNPAKVSRSVPVVEETQLEDSDYDADEEVVDEVAPVSDVALSPEEDTVSSVDDDVELEDELLDEEIDNEDVSEEEEAAALAAAERARLRTTTQTKMAPTSPPPEKAKVASKTVPKKR